jgi:hypothetical protein
MAAPRKYPPELKERALRLWRSEQPRRPMRTSPASLVCIPRRCGPGSARTRPTAASVVTGRPLANWRRCGSLASGCGAGTRQRDPQGGQCLVCPGARPDPATVMRFVAEYRDQFGAGRCAEDHGKRAGRSHGGHPSRLIVHHGSPVCLSASPTTVAARLLPLSCYSSPGPVSGPQHAMSLARPWRCRHTLLDADRDPATRPRIFL